MTHYICLPPRCQLLISKEWKLPDRAGKTKITSYQYYNIYRSCQLCSWDQFQVLVLTFKFQNEIGSGYLNNCLLPYYITWSIGPLFLSCWSLLPCGIKGWGNLLASLSLNTVWHLSAPIAANLLGEESLGWWHRLWHLHLASDRAALGHHSQWVGNVGSGLGQSKA